MEDRSHLYKRPRGRPRKPPKKHKYDITHLKREYSQAERIIAKFGGARKLAALLLIVGKPRNPSSIFRWTYPREDGGTGGLIPTRAWPDILLAARLEGIILENEMTDVRSFVPRKKYLQEDIWD